VVKFLVSQAIALDHDHQPESGKDRSPCDEIKKILTTKITKRWDLKHSGRIFIMEMYFTSDF
jgi:hypothetical protein